MQDETQELPILVWSANWFLGEYFLIKRFGTFKEADAWVQLMKPERPKHYYVQHEEDS